MKSYVRSQAEKGDPVALAHLRSPTITPEVYRHAKSRLAQLGMRWSDIDFGPGPLTKEVIDEAIASIERQKKTRRRR